MSYENSEACKMLATHCAACGRPLVDAKSVELGIGPDCRRKYRFDDESITDDKRKTANKLVYDIARLQRGPDVASMTDKLDRLGFTKLAARIRKRTIKITITFGNSRQSCWELKIPYLDGTKTELQLRGIPGSWDKRKKVWVIRRNPTNQQRLWKFLTDFFEGDVAEGPKGVFIVGVRP